MQRITVIAAVLLLLQIGLVAIFNMQNKTFEPYTPNVAVEQFQAADIDSIQVFGRDGEQISLKRNTDAWVIADKSEVPANSGQVNDFLEKLAGFKRGLAVATTKDAADRFEVGSENFASHMLLKNGEETVADMYFGTSTGYKQLHARTEGSDEIITVALGSHEVAPEVEQWIDKNLLNIDQSKLLRVEVKGIILEKDGEESWKASNSDGKEAKDTVLETLAEKICTLNVRGIAENSGADDGEAEDSLSIAATLEDGIAVKLILRKIGDDDYRVQRSDRPYTLTVSSWQVDEITEQLKKVSELFAEEEAEETGKAAAEAVPQNEVKTE